MTVGFSRFLRKQRIDLLALFTALDRAAKGQVDANLGGSLIKQRVARSGQGKSGGYRAVIAYRRGEVAVFLYGFAKNERDNIGQSDLEALKAYGHLYLGFTSGQLDASVKSGALLELKEHD
jgi:hypothetical protein